MVRHMAKHFSFEGHRTFHRNPVCPGILHHVYASFVGTGTSYRGTHVSQRSTGHELATDAREPAKHGHERATDARNVAWAP
jgi:hypothetical protein